MRSVPNLKTALVVYVVYNAIIYATWAAVGAQYVNMVGPDVAAHSLVLPLVLGGVFVMVALALTGWWQPVMKESRPGRPRWVLWIAVAIWSSVMLINLAMTDWSRLAAGHIALLALAGVFVGFNEEAVTRGFLITGLRSKTSNEMAVWFGSTALFGLLHLPNAFFGIGLMPAAVQVVFAFLAGCVLYVVRRLSGSLALPMVLHGIWDFSSFAAAASGAHIADVRTLLQFGTYLVGLLAAIIVLWMDRRTNAKPA